MKMFFRFFIATPLAFIITAIIFLGVYNQLTPRPFLYTSPEEPGNIYFEDQIVCICRGYPIYWLPEKPDTDNTWITNDKPVKEAPKVESGTPEPIIVGLSGIQDQFKRDEYRGRGASPIYPVACIEKGASGSVIAQYDITPEGRTTNIAILESADECFNAEVIRVLEIYRFQPKISADGHPVWRRGVLVQFNFILSE
jgi:TonB family protein